MQGNSKSVLIIAWALALLLSGCSLKDRQVSYGVSLQLSPSARQQLARAALIQRDGIAGIAAPTAVSGLQCFALNITGPGLQSDPRFGCTDPSQNMGIMAGMADVSGGKIEAMVPAGASRTIQLLGFQSTIGCLSFEEVLKGKESGDPKYDGIGEPYLLGSATIDVFGDTSVNINPVFDPNAILFKDCGGSGPAKEIAFQVINNSPVVQSGRCAPLPVNAHYDPTVDAEPSAVKPLVTGVSPSGAAVAFYTDSSCSPGSKFDPSTSAAIPFNANSGHLALWVQTDASVTSFTVKPSINDSSWAVRETTYRTVNQSIIPAMPAPPLMASATACLPIALSRDGGAQIPAGTSLVLSIYNNGTQGQTLSSAQLFTAADCNAGSAIASIVDGQQRRYTFSVPTGSQIFIRDAAPDQLGIGISAYDNSYQPAGDGLQFNLFLMAATVSPSLVALDGGPAPLSFSFSGDARSISRVLIDGNDCTVDPLSQSASGLACDPPANSSVGPKGIEFEFVYNGVTQRVPAPPGFSLSYAPFASGNGTTSALAYAVHDVDSFLAMGDAQFSGKYFVLTDVIDLSTTPAGSGDFYLPYFDGTLAGGGFAIQNMMGGLAKTCSGAKVKNVTFTNVAISAVDPGNPAVGAVCGTAGAGMGGNTQLYDLDLSGFVANYNSTHATGGIVGVMSTGSELLRTRSSLSVSAPNAGRLGGAVGHLNGGSVTYVAITGLVASQDLGSGVPGNTSSLTGGLAGEIQSGTIHRSFSRATVRYGQYTGGLVGQGSGGYITESFYHGKIGDSGALPYKAGGLAGTVGVTALQDNFAWAEVSAIFAAAGLVANVSPGATIQYNYSASGALTKTDASGVAAMSIAYDANNLVGTGANNYVAYAALTSGGVSSAEGAGVAPVSEPTLGAYSAIANRTLWKSRSGYSGSFGGRPVLGWTCKNRQITALDTELATRAGFDCD